MDLLHVNWVYTSFSSLPPSSIVSERHIQRNFQLIVITHDDEFVEMLGRSKFVDDYYHVSKDSE